jgi:hypothetical protein
MRSQLHRRVVLARLLVVLAVFGLVWVGCIDQLDRPTAPASGGQAKVAPAPVEILSLANPHVQAVMATQNRHTPDLMRDGNVVGTATGRAPSGELAILVFTAEPAAAGSLPASLDGVPVVEQVTGRLVAKKGPPGGGTSHTAIQTPPIQLGTSGGWRFDLANGFCCGGTLGSLVQKGGTQYVMSNYHVLYSDIVNGGNGRTAQPGDAVIQPGLIDVGCNANSAQNVATLVAGGGSLPGANVDVGIAAVISGMVQTDGSILEVGTISAAPVAAFVGQAVKKSGRTTALSRSTVSGLNGTVQIGYEDECAGNPSFTKTFTGQIIIANRRCNFLDGGDSGSLMVEDVTTNPHPVGLLYAGSVQCSNQAVAIANPIGDVLAFLGATMVGN